MRVLRHMCIFMKVQKDLSCLVSLEKKPENNSNL